MHYKGIHQKRKLEFDGERHIVLEDEISGSGKAYQCWNLICKADIEQNEIKGDCFSIKTDTNLIESEEGIYSNEYNLLSKNRRFLLPIEKMCIRDRGKASRAFPVTRGYQDGNELPAAGEALDEENGRCV